MPSCRGVESISAGPPLHQPLGRWLLHHPGERPRSPTTALPSPGHTNCPRLLRCFPGQLLLRELFSAQAGKEGKGIIQTELTASSAPAAPEGSSPISPGLWFHSATPRPLGTRPRQPPSEPCPEEPGSSQKAADADPIAPSPSAPLLAAHPSPEDSVNTDQVMLTSAPGWIGGFLKKPSASSGWGRSRTVPGFSELPGKPTESTKGVQGVLHKNFLTC